MDNGFTNLRQNDGRLLDDSFWPSFTDVMTVIVMVFLIATTVLIIKNWELVRELELRILNEKDISAALKETIVEKNKTHQQLLANIAAKKQISLELEASIVALQRTNEIAEQNQEENKTLEQQLEHTKANLQLIRLQLLKKDEQLYQNKSALSNKEQTINKQKAQLLSLTEQLDLSFKDVKLKEQKIVIQNKDLIQIQSLLDKSRIRTSKLQKNLDSSSIEIQQARQDIKQSKQQLKEKQRIITENKSTITSWEQKLNTLMARFFKLDQQLSENKKQYLKEQASFLEKQQLIENLSKQKDKQINRLTQSAKQRTRALETDKKTILSLNSQFQKSQTDLQKQLKRAQDKEQILAELNKNYLVKQQQIKSIQEQLLLAQQQQGKQRKKFTALEEKYKKLIRPARSALGKYVVEVRYEKVNGQGLISYRDISDDKFNILDMPEIDKRLAKLKQQYAQRLYVKVIIPDNSGLSYKEAWQFMQGIFNKYDYYYQETDNNL
ncbi:MAG: hypothetical protein QM479_09830 [Pseudomonadota bacterium]